MVETGGTDPKNLTFLQTVAEIDPNDGDCFLLNGSSIAW